MTYLLGLVYDGHSMSATLTEATERIYQTFKTDWGVTSPLVFDNEKSVAPKPTDDWVRLSVRHNTSNQESLGGVGFRKFERGGSVFVQCFTPLDKGRAGADALAEAARNIFEGKTLSPESIRFTNTIVQEIGEDDGWYVVNVESLFTYTETK